MGSNALDRDKRNVEGRVENCILPIRDFGFRVILPLLFIIRGKFLRNFFRLWKIKSSKVCRKVRKFLMDDAERRRL